MTVPYELCKTTEGGELITLPRFILTNLLSMYLVTNLHNYYIYIETIEAYEV